MINHTKLLETKLFGRTLNSPIGLAAGYEVNAKVNVPPDFLINK
jgi:hypothetical protein